MLCVKEPRDIARAITTIIESNATDRTFVELRSNSEPNPAVLKAGSRKPTLPFSKQAVENGSNSPAQVGQSSVSRQPALLRPSILSG